MEEKKDNFRLMLIENSMSEVEKRNEIEYLIGKRDELLHSFGYYINDNNAFGKYDSNIISGILGFAIGDALGVPVESVKREKMEKIHLSEMIGYCKHKVPVGTWSDDTSMILATIDSINKKNIIDYKDIMFKFSEWIIDCKYTAIGKVFDAGNTVRISLSRYKEGVQPICCGSKDINSNGNGSLMRILPIVYFLCYNNFTEEEEVQIINNVSSLTHAHEISCLGCKILFDFIKQLLIGNDKFKAIEHIKKINYNQYYSDNAISYYNRIFSSDISKFSKDMIRSSGYIVDTLEASLWCTLISNSYEESVINAINLGGDTDTIGAITGGLSGIVYSKEQIPSEWLIKLRKRKYVEDISKDFSIFLNDNIKKSR